MITYKRHGRVFKFPPKELQDEMMVEAHSSYIASKSHSPFTPEWKEEQAQVFKELNKLV